MGIKLTKRQRQVWRLIAESQNVKSMALILKLSTKTVEFHRAKLMENLRIFDVAGLTREAIKRHIIILS